MKYRTATKDIEVANTDNSIYTSCQPSLHELESLCTATAGRHGLSGLGTAGSGLESLCTATAGRHGLSGLGTAGSELATVTGLLTLVLFSTSGTSLTMLNGGISTCGLATVFEDALQQQDPIE